MAEYYGTPTTSIEDFLAHYGIKGMKWGVRKALESGNVKRLGRQYVKAQRKLQKLQKRADVNAQKQLADKMNKVSKTARRAGHIGVGMGIAGTGTNHTLHYINTLYKKLYNADVKDLDRKSSEILRDHENAFKYINKQRNELGEEKYRKLTDNLVEEHNRAQDAVGDHIESLKKEFNKGKDNRKLAADIGRYVGNAGAGLAVAGYGTAIGAKVKAHAAKKRTTAEGHKKAVAERDAWKKEMQRAFKGTKYASMPRVSSNRDKLKKKINKATKIVRTASSSRGLKK